jgi:hypothetical protein
MDPTGTLATRRRQILEALQGRPDGVTRPELQALASLHELDEQAVRRLLTQLVEQGVARVTGQTKARRYFPGQAAAAAGPPLSPEGQACRGLLAQLPAQRPPAGYQPGFLASYRPNETCYLPQADRRRLAALAGSRTRPPRRHLLVELAWDSVRLEGGRWSKAETRLLFERGEAPAGKPLHETQVMLNLHAAIEFMAESAREVAVDPTTLLNLSALLTENLLADPGDEGRLRSRELAVPGTAYRPAGSAQLIADEFKLLLRSAAEITDPIEQSFFLLVHLSYLHPFSAGNLACAQLAANIPFFRGNTPPLCFLGVATDLFTEALRAVWELNQVALLRDLYELSYERSCQMAAAAQPPLDLPDPFRLRYRTELKAVVRAAVLAGETLAEAERRSRGFAQARLPREDRERFRAAVETELASLHDGNFARYQLRPSEFAAWKPRGR